VAISGVKNADALVSITVDTSDIDSFIEWSRTLNVKLQRWAAVVGPLFREAIAAEAPRATQPGYNPPGRLADSTFYTKRQTALGITLLYTSRWRYADYVIKGTQPHDVSPKVRRVLHWTDAGGNEHFSMSSSDVYTPANPYPTRAFEKTGVVITEMLRNEFRV
jgi:hypothetical protein